MERYKIWDEAYAQMLSLYGEHLPWQVLDRFEKERFLLTKPCLKMLSFLGKLQREAVSVKTPVILRGQHTASFMGHLLGASAVNPLPAHYICPVCHKMEFVKDARSGFDLPTKKCTCGTEMAGDGHNIPVEALAQQVRGYNSLEFGVSADFFPIAERMIHTYWSENYDVTPMKIDGDDDNVVYVMLPHGKALEADADGYVHITGDEYGNEYMDYLHIRVDHSHLADRLQRAWRKAEILPTPYQFCENENLLAWQFGCEELNESLAETMLEQTLQFSTLVQESGFLHGTGNWIGNGEKLVAQGVDFMAIPADREGVFQKITARRPKAIGLAVRVMEDTRKGRFAHKCMPAETENALREMGMKPWFIDYCKNTGYLFPRAHAVEFLRWELIMKWFESHGYETCERG